MKQQTIIPKNSTAAAWSDVQYISLSKSFDGKVLTQRNILVHFVPRASKNPLRNLQWDWGARCSDVKHCDIGIHHGGLRGLDQRWKTTNRGGAFMTDIFMPAWEEQHVSQYLPLYVTTYLEYASGHDSAAYLLIWPQRCVGWHKTDARWDMGHSTSMSCVLYCQQYSTT